MSTVRDKEAEPDDILEDDEEDTVPLEEIADMSSDDDS